MTATRSLVLVAAVLTALLAAVGADRLIVTNHAWALTGARNWAEYTRVADLGRARIWYPAIGLAALVVSISAALVARREPTASRSATTALAGAALLSIVALVVTLFEVVPATMTALAAHASADALETAWASVARWWAVKAVLHILTFMATIRAVAEISDREHQSSSTLRSLMVVAVILGGFLSGGNIDRAFIQMPSWRLLGPAAWADFSRHADMGNGFFWYPFEAIGATLCLLGSVIAVRRSGSAGRAMVPLVIALLLAIGGLAITTQAAPNMLSIRSIADTNTTALQNAFDGFEWWGDLRGLVQAGAFLASLWALSVLGLTPDAGRPRT